MRKLKIANYSDDIRRIGRNDGNPLYAKVALEELGHEVVHLIPDAKLLGGFNEKDFDLHLWCDWGEDGLLDMGWLDYKPIAIPHPGAYWISDTHLGYKYRLSKALEADYAFCCMKDAVEPMRRDGVKNVFWLPHSFEPRAYPKKNVIKKYDVGFVGHINSENRVDFLDAMFKEFPNFWYGQRLFEDAAYIYNQSKIVLNPPINNDLNMRIHEAMGAGAFMLTLDVPGIRDMFEDGKHLVLYKDTKEAIEKAKYYIAHDEEREAIALAGYQRAMSCNTYRHRMLEILKITGVGKGLPEVDNFEIEAWKLNKTQEKEKCLQP